MKGHEASAPRVNHLPHGPQRNDCLHGLAPKCKTVAVEEPERPAFKISETQKGVGQQSGAIDRLLQWGLGAVAAILLHGSVRQII